MTVRRITRKDIMMKAKVELNRSREYRRLRPLFEQLEGICSDLRSNGVKVIRELSLYEGERVRVKSGSEQVSVGDLAKCLISIKGDIPVDMEFEDERMNEVYDIIRRVKIAISIPEGSTIPQIVQMYREAVKDVILELESGFVDAGIADGIGFAIRGSYQDMRLEIARRMALEFRTIRLFVMLNLVFEVSRVTEVQDLEFFSFEAPKDYGEWCKKIERLERKIEKLESKGRKSRNEQRTLSIAKRERLELLCPIAIGELRALVNAEPQKRSIKVTGSMSWVEEKTTEIIRTEYEDKEILKRDFPNLYRMMIKEDIERREASKKIRKTCRELDQLGVPKEYYVPKINEGIVDSLRILEMYLETIQVKSGETEERQIVVVREVRNIEPETRALESKKSIVNGTKKSKNEDARRILREMVFGRFGKRFREIEDSQRALIERNIESIFSFINEYISYLSKERGERGSFGNEGRVNGTEFRERTIADGKDSEDWRVFVLNSGSSRIGICVRPETGEIALYIAEVNHEEYTKKLYRFNTNDLRKRVRIRVREERVTSSIVVD
ncbi:MAG: hypothetical protein PHU63_02385 [Candidatus ainarchaeum sp.]|nr:hypothetical protein [Candidatus ainarchaeum sp.]